MSADGVCSMPWQRKCVHSVYATSRALCLLQARPQASSRRYAPSGKRSPYCLLGFSERALACTALLLFPKLSDLGPEHRRRTPHQTAPHRTAWTCRESTPPLNTKKSLSLLLFGGRTLLSYRCATVLSSLPLTAFHMR